MVASRLAPEIAVLTYGHGTAGSIAGRAIILGAWRPIFAKRRNNRGEPGQDKSKWL